ncbi:alpha/beta fold hydrolase [Mycobacterium mantenii]|uniref:Alpha/beta hydrolase n=1 Tax=Mycobacterium mantenii TaxID=560555 RepID=A0A1X0FM13_MYCNT|nr:alpha/beta fold hydrolase [Mycobacterium mantenii]MCV7246495.1 alpha/beta fold hydrolase [Mycobacterium mantenii]ORB02862.1 alpha/beta hydrolase [Mycobacterium mantenii]
MTLETIEKGRGSETHPIPLLFVHGGWHAAWCWDKNFLKFFADRGFRAVGVSLRGHGQSGTSKPLRSCSIGDYIDDVRSVIENLDGRAVLIGHSMGGFIVQKYLQNHRAPAAVLMASIPPQGVLRPALRLVGRHPWVTLRATTVGSSADFVNTTRLARDALFCAHTPERIVESCAAQLQSESVHATAVGMSFPGRPRQVTTRLLVLGAEDDRMVNQAEVRATARAYRTRAEIFPAMGHDMMLEPGWIRVAERIDEWLSALRL